MSQERASMIADKLAIEGQEKEFFVDLVLAYDARSKKGKLDARRRLLTKFPDRVPTFH